MRTRPLRRPGPGSRVRRQIAPGARRGLQGSRAARKAVERRARRRSGNGPQGRRSQGGPGQSGIGCRSGSGQAVHSVFRRGFGKSGGACGSAAGCRGFPLKDSVVLASFSVAVLYCWPFWRRGSRSPRLAAQEAAPAQQPAASSTPGVASTPQKVTRRGEQQISPCAHRAVAGQDDASRCSRPLPHLRTAQLRHHFLCHRDSARPDAAQDPPRPHEKLRTSSSRHARRPRTPTPGSVRLRLSSPILTKRSPGSAPRWKWKSSGRGPHQGHSGRGKRAHRLRRRAGNWQGCRSCSPRIASFAADLAIEQAAKQMVLTPETDRALIAEFFSDLASRNERRAELNGSLRLPVTPAPFSTSSTQPSSMQPPSTAS